MIKVEVNGTIQDVAKVINALYEDTLGEVVIVGEGADEIQEAVIKNLKDFKVEYTDNTFDTDYYIQIFD